MTSQLSDLPPVLRLFVCSRACLLRGRTCLGSGFDRSGRHLWLCSPFVPLARRLRVGEERGLVGEASHARAHQRERGQHMGELGAFPRHGRGRSCRFGTQRTSTCGSCRRWTNHCSMTCCCLSILHNHRPFCSIPFEISDVLKAFGGAGRGVSQHSSQCGL